MSAQLASFKADATSREEQIRKAAAAKRKELESLQTGRGGFLPFILAVETARSARIDLSKQYDASLVTISKSVSATYNQKLAGLASLTMDPWENERKFKGRVTAERARLSGEKQAALADASAATQQKKQAALIPFVDAETNSLAGLEKSSATYKGSAVKMVIGAFDRDAKLFHITLSSASPDLVYTATFSYSVKGDSTEELKRKYLEFNAWNKAGGLFGEIDVSVHAVGSMGYVKVIDAIRFKAVDAAGERILYEESPNRLAACFSGSTDLKVPRQVGSHILILAQGAKIAINDKDAGKDNAIILNPKAGSYTIRATIGDGTFLEESRRLAAGAMETVRFALPGTKDSSADKSGNLGLNGKTVSNDDTRSYAVGKLGPAGGLIFYDKGDHSDGWRYLEAAPSDQSAKMQWYNGNALDIETGTAIGTGKANTEAIIAAQGRGSYAATLCKNLSIGGFSDWFLPSEDELGLIYTNLRKAGLGSFYEGWHWSSSQSSSYNAWKQRFSDGGQSGTGKGRHFAVRACRAF